jgi:hypothetical protein
MAHLISEFKLEDSPLLQTETKLMQAAYMLLKRTACFSFDGNYGQTTLLKHSIVTDPDQRPINQRFRPTPLRAFVQYVFMIMFSAESMTRPVRPECERSANPNTTVEKKITKKITVIIRVK